MRTKKKLMALLLTVCVCVGMAMPAFAENGPSSGANSSAWVVVGREGEADTQKCLYRNADESKFDKVEGAVYDKATNTITLTNYNHPDMSLITNEMGDDLKLKLVGDNHIRNLIVWGFYWGGSLEIVGDGALTINENKEELVPISFRAESTEGMLKVGPKATLTAYSGPGENDFSMAFYETTSSTVPFKGNLETELTLTPSSGIEIEAKEGAVIIRESSYSADQYTVYTKAGDTEKYAIYYDYMSGMDSDGEWYTEPTAYVYKLIKVDGLPSGNEYLAVIWEYVRGASEENPAEGYTATDEVITAKQGNTTMVDVVKKDGQTYYWGGSRRDGYSVYKSILDNVALPDLYSAKEACVAIPVGGEGTTGETVDDIPAGYTVNMVKTGVYNYYCTNEVIKVVPSGEPEVTKGDVNGDGKVDLLDLRMLLRYICGKTKLNETEMSAANMVGADEKVDLLDLRQLLRVICGKA